MTAATTKIAVCYPTESNRRLVVIYRDNRTSRQNRVGRYVVTVVHDNVGESSTRYASEEAALSYAADLGYTDVVRS